MSNELLKQATDIVTAYVSNNKVDPTELPTIIDTIYNNLLDKENGEYNSGKPTPSVPIDESVQEDYIVCLEDGAKMKMLKRYLRNKYNLTPEDYRAKWGLPATYPMTAPGYAKHRSAIAKNIGLGKKND